MKKFSVTLLFTSVWPLVVLLTGCGDVPIKELPEEIQEGSNSSGQPTPFSTPLEIAIDNPDCTQIMGTDGPGGFLWKPRGDHSNALVILLRDAYRQEFEDCVVRRSDGTVESMQFTGFSNGNRQTWRGSRPGGAYDGWLRCYEKRQTCTWRVRNPANRQD